MIAVTKVQRGTERLLPFCNACLKGRPTIKVKASPDGYAMYLCEGCRVEMIRELEKTI